MPSHNNFSIQYSTILLTNNAVNFDRYRGAVSATGGGDKAHPSTFSSPDIVGRDNAIYVP